MVCIVCAPPKVLFAHATKRLCLQKVRFANVCSLYCKETMFTE